ncbi:hypothetical protein C8F01DRAFT_1011850 [Mycena amicta]|nr:hypothetical protein C8F01DRAFT_1011850 [Mycena amicta]
MPPLSYVPGNVFWRPTKIMTNARDLSKDDDFLSHLLVEKLGTGTVPLLVHKMDSSRRLPKTNADDILKIVRRLVATKAPISLTIRQAVDQLLVLPSIRYYLRQANQKQINAFATHATRYFELYHPSGCIEIAHTSRYSHKTGKSELCILATRNLSPGSVITELKGSMANLSDEEDRDLKRTDLRNSDIRRDFSVIHSKQMKKNHLFLGPARFVNHDCDNNCELFREGKYITFRVLRPIAIGEEITAHYGDGYFGKKNRHCLCESCEKRGRGGYAPDHTDEDPPLSSDSESDTSSDSDSDSDTGAKPRLDLNERRTRRGVYATMPVDESDNEEAEIELVAEVDAASDLTSLPPSRAQSNGAAVGLQTPQSPVMSPLTVLSPTLTTRSSSALTALSSADDRLPSSTSSSTPFRSIISTRKQRAQADAAKQLITPPPSENPDTPTKRVTRSTSTKVPSAADAGASRGANKTGSQPATPVPALSAATRKGKEKETVNVKKEETELPRILRTRPSFPAVAEPSKEPPAPAEPPRGPDGKLLPICSTCSNILPVISVDSQVVWGLEVTGRKKKQQCPRCLRHYEIYGQPWPCRVSLDGPTYTLPTPREDATPAESSSRRVNKKALSVLDRKLAAAAEAADGSVSKRHGDAEDSRPFKRRKTEPTLPAETSKSLKNGGRHSLPGSTGVSSRHKAPSPSTSDSEDDDDDEAEPPVKVQKSPPKARAKPAASTPQPTLSRAQRAEEREKVRRWLERKNKEEAEAKEDDGSGRKRSSAELDDSEDTARRKVPRAEKQLPFQRVVPRPSSGFRGGQLVARPNPLSYALHAWASPLLSTASSSEDELPPDTPEDEVNVHLAPRVKSPTVDVMFKPTPFTFARRRWGMGSASPQDENKRSYLGFPSPLSAGSESEQPIKAHPPTSDPFARAPSHPMGPVNRYVSPVSSLDSPSESAADIVGSPTQDNLLRTPPSSPFLIDSDCSPLPLLHRITSPMSSPLSSLYSDVEEESVPSFSLVKESADAVKVAALNVLSSRLVSEREDSPLTSSINSDPDF